MLVNFLPVVGKFSFLFRVNFLQKHRAKHPVASRFFKFLWFRLVWCSLVPDRFRPLRIGLGCTPSKWPFTPWLKNGGDPNHLPNYWDLDRWKMIPRYWCRMLPMLTTRIVYELRVKGKLRIGCILDVYWMRDCWNWIRMWLYNWMYLKMYALNSLSISWLSYWYFDINMLTDLRD